MTATGTAGGELPALDPNKPSPARIYDYMLGGTHNFAADRDAAQAIIAEFPALPQVLRAVRSFVRRSTHFLAAQAGVGQFLDLGSGIPTVQNVHEVAQAASPASRVAYVDIDPIAVVHSRRILAGNPGAVCIQGDMRDPAAICAAPEVRAMIDFSRPVAVLMSAVLHFIADDAEAAAIVSGYLATVPAGSYLIICHHTSESTDENEARARAIYSSRAQPLIPRSRAQIASFFQGLELVEPGVVLTPQWRPDGVDLPAPEGSAPVPEYFAYVGVGRKPALATS